MRGDRSVPLCVVCFISGLAPDDGHSSARNMLSL